eukprot:TRINITY_DN12232_c0_g1_i1.p1 TRINITY_DN12232_c0_g1~~TRINITY_DN12232_c0_g1_i1.p1  ORF type:complete len:325 (-),score=22.95 TRINITY_DN12232_c0_g1_i1:725-1699(-)
MKVFLAAFLGMFFCLVPPTVMSATFYISSSGSDAYSPFQAQSAATPWKSLAKVASAINGGLINDGDTIAFERGSVFFGNMSLGTNLVNLVFRDYGDQSLPQPILTGESHVSTPWTVHSGSIYKTVLPTPYPSNVYTVRFNGQRMIKARWPNLSLGSTSASFSRTSQVSATAAVFSDPAVSVPSGTYNGARLIFRSVPWAYEDCIIASHVNVSGKGGEFTCDSSYTGTFDAGAGYWLEGLLVMLDNAGEWFYDASTGTLYLHAPGGVVPSNVDIVTVASGIESQGANNVTISNLHFTKYGSRAWESRRDNGFPRARQPQVHQQHH